MIYGSHWCYMESKIKEKVRSSNIELLRIVAMFMIVTYHIVVHCVDVQLTSSDPSGVAAYGFFDHPVFYKRILILNTIMTFGIVGNAIFILILGYFLASRTGDKKSGMHICGRGHCLNPVWMGDGAVEKME